MSQHGTIVVPGIDPGGAMAEEFSLRIELLVYLESDPQSDLSVVQRICHANTLQPSTKARE